MVKNQLEVVVHSQVQVSDIELDIPNIKTVGSSQITFGEPHNYNEYDRVTFRAQVMKISEPQKVHRE